MSYTYNPGDPVTVLVTTEPNGATEPKSILDDAIKQIKKYLNDPTVGPDAKIAALSTTVGGNETARDVEIADILAAISGGQDDITALQDDTGGKATANRLSAQSVSAGTGWQVVGFNNEEFDSAGAFDIGSFTYTVPLAGLYLVTAQIQVEKTASAVPTGIEHDFSIFVGGAEGANHHIEAGTTELQQTLMINRMFNLTAGQTITARYRLVVASGTMTVEIIGSPIQSIFQIARITA